MNNTIKIINTSNNPNPEYKTKGSSGMDVRAFLAETVEIEPLNRALIKTGVFIEMDETLREYLRTKRDVSERGHKKEDIQKQLKVKIQPRHLF